MGPSGISPPWVAKSPAAIAGVGSVHSSLLVAATSDARVVRGKQSNEVTPPAPRKMPSLKIINFKGYPATDYLSVLLLTLVTDFQFLPMAFILQRVFYLYFL